MACLSKERNSSYRIHWKFAQRLREFPEADVLSAIRRIREGSEATDRSVKEVEFEALASAKDEIGSDLPEGDFFARKLPEEAWQVPHMRGVERVILVHRLREVVAQLGFTRFESAGPDVDGELDINVQRAPLA